MSPDGLSTCTDRRLASPCVARGLPTSAPLVWLPRSGRRRVIRLHICSRVDRVADEPESPCHRDDTAGLTLLWCSDPMIYFRARNVPQFGTISTRPSSARRRSALMTVFRATP